ncbi:urocanate hydratase, partial [Escherichia coli]|nr:urocanate hydratase [Escherichia coli]
LPELVKRNITPDLVTDQTSAHDPLNGYIPVGYTLEEAAKLREEDPERYVQLSKEGMTKHVEAMLAMQEKGAITFDYGNNIRQVAFDEGLKNA